MWDRRWSGGWGVVVGGVRNDLWGETNRDPFVGDLASDFQVFVPCSNVGVACLRNGDDGASSRRRGEAAAAGAATRTRTREGAQKRIEAHAKGARRCILKLKFESSLELS